MRVLPTDAIREHFAGDTQERVTIAVLCDFIDAQAAAEDQTDALMAGILRIAKDRLARAEAERDSAHARELEAAKCVADISVRLTKAESERDEMSFRQASASEAWEQGYQSGHADGRRHDTIQARNPYRDTQTVRAGRMASGL